METDENEVDKLVKKYSYLQRVISNKYVTVIDRLKLDFVPVCAENLEHCFSKHYKTPPPKLPSPQQMILLQNSLQQSRYAVFTDLVWSQCRAGQFPGDVVLTNIIKLLLTLNPENKHNNFLQPILDQLLCLFDQVLRSFPPCWLALRPSYMKFLRNTIEMSKLLPNKTYKAEMTIFELALMFLEDTIDAREPQKSNNAMADCDDEYMNLQHWERRDNEEQTFSALSKATRLDRLMQVLHLIAKLLEMDMAMWMLRYHKHPIDHVYSEEDQPLVVTLFSLSKYTRSSVLVKKAMTLFALCVQKDLSEDYLKILERFISLLANLQNICEIETTSDGICYPVVGAGTKSFVKDFFKICDTNMKNNVGSYMRLIRILRCPFLCYEFIDIFLHRLNAHPGKMCPQKIVENFRKKRWLECESDEECDLPKKSNPKQSIVYRRDYLAILLQALRTYCDFHGTKEYLNMDDSQMEAAKCGENRESISIPRISNNKIKLSVLAKKIGALEKKADMSIKLREPQIKIPLVNIRVNSDLYSEYRNDLKYVMILQKYISTLQEQSDDDFSEYMDFLKDFAPKY